MMCISFGFVFNDSLSFNILSLGITFAIGISIYAMGFWGAGDVKLSCVLSVLVPFEHLFSSYYYMVILGGVISLFYLIKSMISTSKHDDGIPYGVAISLGFISVIFSTSL